MSSINQLFLFLIACTVSPAIFGDELSHLQSADFENSNVKYLPNVGPTGYFINWTADDCDPLSASEQTGNTSSAFARCPSDATTAANPRDPGLPDEHQYVLIALYTATTALAVTGNLVVLVVLSVGRRSRTDLRAFLLNLAVADLIMAAFCMPFTFTTTMLHDWIFGSVMCTVVLFVQVMSVTASVATSTVIAVDRYLVVARPLRRRASRRSRLVAVWLISGGLASVQLFVARSSTIKTESGIQLTVCAEQWPEPGSDTWRFAYTFFILLTTYLLPLGAIAPAYACVARRLWRRRPPGNADTARDLNQLMSKRRVIKMLIMVVTLFAVCWLPLHLFMLVSEFVQQLRSEEQPEASGIFIAIYTTVHWLAMSNSFVNPIVYGFLNDSFRYDLRWLVMVCWRRTRRRCGCTEASLGPFDADPDYLDDMAGAAGDSIMHSVAGGYTAYGFRPNSSSPCVTGMTFSGRHGRVCKQACNMSPHLCSATGSQLQSHEVRRYERTRHLLPQQNQCQWRYQNFQQRRPTSLSIGDPSCTTIAVANEPYRRHSSACANGAVAQSKCCPECGRQSRMQKPSCEAEGSSCCSSNERFPLTIDSPHRLATPSLLPQSTTSESDSGTVGLDRRQSPPTTPGSTSTGVTGTASITSILMVPTLTVIDDCGNVTAVQNTEF